MVFAPAIARLEEDLMWFGVDHFTWQTERIARFHLTTTTVRINTQLVEHFHGIRQTVMHLQQFTHHNITHQTVSHVATQVHSSYQFCLTDVTRSG